MTSNAFSFVLQIVLKLLSGKFPCSHSSSSNDTGFVTDRWQADETLKSRLFNTISCGLSGVLMIALAFVNETEKVR